MKKPEKQSKIMMAIYLAAVKDIKERWYGEPNSIIPHLVAMILDPRFKNRVANNDESLRHLALINLQKNFEVISLFNYKFIFCC